MPLVSVIVPVYNVESKLCRCIDSILNQSFTDFELLLIDDGSCDKSGEICDDYRDKDYRIKVFHQKNKGVSSARNAGINAATGKYICFVDSDDYIELEYIRVLYQGMNDAQLAICGVFYCKENMGVVSQQAAYNDFSLTLNSGCTNVLSKLLEDGRLNYVYSKMYLKQIITDNRINFREDISLGEDTFFVFDYLKCISTIFVIGDPYYMYFRYDDNTLTTVFRDDLYNQYKRVNQKIESVLSEIGLLDNMTKRAIDKRRLNAAEWTVDAVIKNKKISFLVKNKHLSSVFNDEDLLVAINSNPDLIKTNLILSNIKDSFPFNLFFRIKINSFTERIKATAVKLLPRFYY